MLNISLHKLYLLKNIITNPNDPNFTLHGSFRTRKRVYPKINFRAENWHFRDHWISRAKNIYLPKTDFFEPKIENFPYTEVLEPKIGIALRTEFIEPKIEFLLRSEVFEPNRDFTQNWNYRTKNRDYTQKWSFRVKVEVSLCI